MSINPISEGHTLVVPTVEIDHWLDLPPATNQHLMAMAQRIGEAQMQVFAPRRVGLMIAGFEVPHVHVHLIPLHSMKNATFQHKESLEAKEFEQIASNIRKQLK